MSSTRWADRQIQLSREFVSKAMSGEEFGPEFLTAQNQSARAKEIPGDDESELINDLLFALSDHTPFDDERLPDQLDDDQLRALIARHLADYDAGKYDPSNW